MKCTGWLTAFSALNAGVMQIWGGSGSASTALYTFGGGSSLYINAASSFTASPVNTGLGIYPYAMGQIILNAATTLTSYNVGVSCDTQSWMYGKSFITFVSVTTQQQGASCYF